MILFTLVDVSFLLECTNKQAAVEGNNDDHPDRGKMRQSN